MRKPLIPLVLAVAAMGATGVVALTGLFFLDGFDTWALVIGLFSGFLSMGIAISPYLRKYGKFTVPAFIGDRFYSRTARTVAVLCLIICSITYVIGQMKGVGVAFGRFLEVDYAVGVAVGMAIVFVYAVLGGMKGITYTQIAQYCVLIFAYTVPAIFISLTLTGMPLPQVGLGGMMADGSGVSLLDKLDGLSKELGFSQYTSGQKSTTDVFFITAALMCGTARWRFPAGRRKYR